MWLLACARHEGLPEGQQLARLSLDLRGVRPDEAELAAVERDPDAYDDFVEAWLADDRFPARVEDLWEEVVLTRGDGYTVDPTLVGAPDAETWHASIGSEIPKFVAELARADLPWTDAVLADWTMADEVVGRIWPTDYPDDTTGWRRVHYTDGRPAAGVLAMNSFYWRYDSTISNANRKRANAVARIFLCQDFLSRQVAFDDSLDLADEAALEDAVKHDPSCVSCHVTVDPLAAHFFGFFYEGDANPADVLWYHPEREPYYTGYLGVAPAYYGTPTTGDLASLGRLVAADSRYPTCAVQHVFEGLFRRPVALADTDALTRHREAFVAGDATLRALYRSVVEDDAYRGQGDADRALVNKMVTPALLASEVEALTGYRWTIDGVDAMASDLSGVRTLAGGLDGFEGTSRATSPGPTVLLVQERLAEAAAAKAVEDDPAGLFDGVDRAAFLDTDSRVFREAVRVLYRRVLSRDATADDLADSADLYSATLAATQDPTQGWEALLAALLRSPELLLY